MWVRGSCWGEEPLNTHYTLFKHSFRGGELQQTQLFQTGMMEGLTSCLYVLAPSWVQWFRVSVSQFSVQNRSVANTQTMLLTAHWPPSAAVCLGAFISRCSSLVPRTHLGEQDWTRRGLKCLKRNGWTWWNVGLGCMRACVLPARWTTMITARWQRAATAAASHQVTVSRDSGLRPDGSRNDLLCFPDTG